MRLRGTVWPALGCLIVLCGAARPAPLLASDPQPAKSPAPPAAGRAGSSKQQVFRGKVVWLREALARHKVESREEFDKQAVLETVDGELIPIVPDWRGRAFFQDERLRNRDVELVGKRAAGTPYLQVLMIFTFDEHKHRQYTDYFCDTCAFPMYELKPCECCQGPLRLRFQPRDLPDYVKSAPGPTPAPSAAGGTTSKR